jgi:hypothetical protein
MRCFVVSIPTRGSITRPPWWPLSNMNESGNHIFSCDYIRNCQFNWWFGEPESKDLNAVDYNKHYTSSLMGKGLIQPNWIKFVYHIQCNFHGCHSIENIEKTNIY